MKKIRVIGYVRVSTEEQATQGYSIDNQKYDIEKHCAYKGWELVEIFEDGGISGSTIEERPGIVSALRYLKENDIDYLIVWKLSRLSRRVSDVAQIADFLKNNNTKFISLQDGIDTGTPMGEYFLILAGIFAQMERENLIVQVRGGMSEKARLGEWCGGQPNLGYDAINGELVINEAEAEIVKTIYQEYINGNGYPAIVDILKEKGYKTKNDKDFSNTGVKDILKNPIYKGFIRWGHRVDWGKKDVDGKRHRKYNEDAICTPGKHVAIISPDIFDRVQELIKENPRHKVKRFQGFHLLSGLLRCPDCGYGMSHQPVNNKGKIYNYYVCNQYMNKKECRANSISQDKIEAEFYDILDKVVSDESFTKAMIKSAATSDVQISELSNRIKRKKKEIEQLESMNDTLFSEALKGDEGYKEYVRNKIQENLHKVKEIQKAILQDEKKLQELQTKVLDMEEIIDVISKAGKIIRELDKAAQQRLIRKLISSIETENRQIKAIHFSFGKVLELEPVQRDVSQIMFMIDVYS